MKKVLGILVLLLLVSCNTVENKFESIFYKKSSAKNPKLIALPSKNPVEVKVAMLLPLSGKYQSLGQSILDSTQLAIFELRAENINYKAIDIGSDLETAKEAIEKADLDDADIVFGPIFKDQAEMVYEKAKKKNLIVLTYSNDMELTNMPGLYIFDIIPFQQINRVSSYASKKEYSNIYSIVSKSKYGELVEKYLIANMGKNHYNVKKLAFYTAPNVPIVRRFTLSEAILSIKGAIKHDISNKIPGFGLPSILLPEQNKNLVNTLNQLQFLHSNSDLKYKILGIGDWNNYPLAQNVVAKNAWIADVPHNELYEFESRFKDNYKYTPPRLAAVAYDSILLLSAIINKANNGIIIKFDELERTEGYRGVTGAFRLKSNGENQRLFSVFEYKSGVMEEIENADLAFK